MSALDRSGRLSSKNRSGHIGKDAASSNISANGHEVIEHTRVLHRGKVIMAGVGRNETTRQQQTLDTCCMHAGHLPVEGNMSREC
jgi:hypothetical protein